MFYSSWMSCIKDDVKITQLAIPGAHNAGTKGMVHMGCCQLGTVLEQFEYGVREFGIRVKQKHGEAYIAHGLSRGVKVEKVFADFEKILEKYPDEFFIIDIRSYQDQKVGPFTLKYHCAPEIINELIEKYLRPADYAFTDFEHIKDAFRQEYSRLGLLEILITLKNMDAHRESVCRDCNISMLQFEKVYGIRSFICDNIDSHYTIEELADKFDMPPTAMKVCFKNVFGLPVFTYARRERMKHAAKQLRECDRGILEIAGTVGYNNGSKFAHAFQDVMGMTPKEYRKRYKQNAA